MWRQVSASLWVQVFAGETCRCCFHMFGWHNVRDQPIGDLVLLARKHSLIKFGR